MSGSSAFADFAFLGGGVQVRADSALDDRVPSNRRAHLAFFAAASAASAAALAASAIRGVCDSKLYVWYYCITKEKKFVSTSRICISDDVIDLMTSALPGDVDPSLSGRAGGGDGGAVWHRTAACTACRWTPSPKRVTRRERRTTSRRSGGGWMSCSSSSGAAAPVRLDGRVGRGFSFGGRRPRVGAAADRERGLYEPISSRPLRGEPPLMIPRPPAPMNHPTCTTSPRELWRLRLLEGEREEACAIARAPPFRSFSRPIASSHLVHIEQKVCQWTCGR